jgi:imidazole glycerol-phosphate synthase subunit HisF
VIASGGYGEPAHLDAVIRQGQADAVAFADVLHHQRASMRDLRDRARERGIAVREA